MDKVKQEIIRTGRWIMEQKLTWGTSGNISAREKDRVYVTASGTVMGDLKEEDILICDQNGRILEGEGKASKETGMHLEVYRRRQDVEAIVHSSPFYSTFCACSDLELKTKLFIESMYYDRAVGRVPYFHAGSAELAKTVGDVCGQCHVILMEHHGILVYDKNLAECRSALEVTENMCRMNVLAKMGGIALQEVPDKTVKDFLEGGYYKRRNV